MSRNHPYASDAPSGSCKACGRSCVAIPVDVGYGPMADGRPPSEDVNWQWRCPYCGGELEPERMER